MSTTENQGQTDFIGEGITPPTPRRAGDWQDNNGQPLNSGQPGQQPLVQPEPQQQPPAQQQPTGRWTDEDLARVRREEKDKLYPELEQMKQQLAEMRKAEEERQAEAQRLADEAAQAQRQREEAEMSAQELIQKKEQEWNERFTALESQRERDRAVYEQERRLVELESYRTARIEQEQEFLLPELRGYIQGNSEEEIDASIERAKADSEAILNNMMAASQQQPVVPFQQPRVASPTTPSVGPMEEQTEQRPVGAADIAAMDMETYKRNRHLLLPAAGNAYRNGGA